MTTTTTAALLGYSSSSSSSSPSSRLCQKWGPSQIHRSTKSPLLPLSLRSGPPQRRRRSSSFHLRAMTMLTTTNNGNSATSSSTNRVYERLESCVVVPPPAPIRPRAILMFLGGAFVGAIPERTYCYLMEMLAKEGFLVLSVPYNVTFDHSKVAWEIFQRFNYCLDLLLSTGFSCGNVSIKATDLAGLPVFSVGHRQMWSSHSITDLLQKLCHTLIRTNSPGGRLVANMRRGGLSTGSDSCCSQMSGRYTSQRWDNFTVASSTCTSFLGPVETDHPSFVTHYRDQMRCLSAGQASSLLLLA